MHILGTAASATALWQIATSLRTSTSDFVVGLLFYCLSIALVDFSKCCASPLLYFVILVDVSFCLQLLRTLCFGVETGTAVVT